MKKSGFTLLELLIVIAIVGILLAVATASYLTTIKQSRDTRRKTDIEQVRQALETFRSENGIYPPQEGSMDQFLVPAYISHLPDDPKDNYSYAYYTNPSYTEYSLCASLEIKPATPISDTCDPTACGVGLCNYEIRNP